jgi:hypothetical protein
MHGVRPSIDEESDESPDNVAAWHQATIIAGEMFKDIDGKFRPGQNWALEVTDDQRKPLYSIQISAKQMK